MIFSERSSSAIRSALPGRPSPDFEIPVMHYVNGNRIQAPFPAGLEPALLPYLTDPALRQAHGAAGRARVVQNFSLDSMVQRYLDLYGDHGEGRAQQLSYVISRTDTAIQELEAKRAKIDETLAEMRVINTTCRRQLELRKRTDKLAD